MNECWWQDGGNAGEYGIYARTLRGQAKYHTVKHLYVAFYGLKWISDVVSCMSECYLLLKFYSVLAWMPFVNNTLSTTAALLVVLGEWELAWLKDALLPDRLYSPSSTLCLLGEGVSWIWSRRVGKQCSEGSWEFQLSPAFFSPLPDGSQMFFKAAALSALALFFIFSPVCVSLALLSHIMPPPSVRPSNFPSL